MLTERQSALLSHLQVAVGGFLKQSEIVNALPQYYPYSENLGVFHDSHARMMLTKDIQAINDSDEVDVIIIHSSKGIKIADEAEFDRYIAKQYASVFRRLARVRKKEAKGRRHGYMRITSDGLEVVEAFPDWQERRKAAGIKAVDVVEHVRKFEPRFDGSLLSKIENGVCLPTKKQEEAFNELYSRHTEVSTTE